jgi:histidinol-phosphate aminotransferase
MTATNARRPVVRDDLVALEGYHSPQVEVPVRLNTNESPFPPPAAFGEALARAVADVAGHRYPDRAATLLGERIGALHGRPAGEVFAANGSNEVLQTLLLAYGGHGRTVVTFEPTYALHGHIARITGAAVAEGERDEGFGLDLEEVHRVVDAASPSVIFLCSPNNPTGMVEPPALVRAVADLAAERAALLVVDEAYGQFAPWSALELVGDDRPLVVTRTYSKTWSMAAARLGYLVGPRWVVEELEKVVLPYHLDVLKQVAGTLALDHLDDMERRVAAIVEERGRLHAALGELDVDVWPSGANCVLFRPRSGDGDGVWKKLLARGVLVRNCASWPRLDGCLRVTIGTRDEDDAFLAALAEAL